MCKTVNGLINQIKDVLNGQCCDVYEYNTLQLLLNEQVKDSSKNPVYIVELCSHSRELYINLKELLQLLGALLPLLHIAGVWM